jgi:hypothetical protein
MMEANENKRIATTKGNILLRFTLIYYLLIDNSRQ